MKTMFFTISAIIIVIVITGCTSTYLGRYVFWQTSDVEDYKKFPSREIKKPEAPYLFAQQASKQFPQMVRYDRTGNSVSLENLLQNNSTTSFIVIRNDSILYERYFNGYERHSINTSFSVAKSITSLLIGIAIDEGYIKSVHNPITDYLPELKERDPRFEKITIAHLLDMKSGLRFVDSDLPWGDRAKAYYSTRLRERALERDIEVEPGKRWKYDTYHPMILGLILERTTGINPAAYLEAKLWKPLGMEFDASWSMDSEAGTMVKMESGINCRSIDLAKIGKLMLAKGLVNGKRIVSEKWIKESMHYDSSNRFPHSTLIHYQRSWWVFEPNAHYQYCVYADGHLGQFIFIFPEQNIIIVRQGKEMGKKEMLGVINWMIVCNDILKQLSIPYSSALK